MPVGHNEKNVLVAYQKLGLLHKEVGRVDCYKNFIINYKSFVKLFQIRGAGKLAK